MTHEHGQHRHTNHHHGDRQDTASAAELAGFLAGAAQPPRRALDLGCGTGRDAVFLAQQGIETTGLDASAHALDLARQHANQHDVHVTWVEGDVLRLPFADGAMDLVLDRGCLHHVAAADQPRYASEVARVLRPGGSLLVREMNEPGHGSLAVTEKSLRSMADGLPLHMRAATSYRAERSGRSIRTLLVVFDRA